MEITILGACLSGAAALSIPLARARRRIELSRAKHRSLAGHVRLARRLALLVPFYEYDEPHFFRSDGAPDGIVSRRCRGFARLASIYRERFPHTRAATAQIRGGASDLQFTSVYRVPFSSAAMPASTWLPVPFSNPPPASP